MLWHEGCTPSAMFRDFRYAFRTLRQSPGFSLVAIVSLALGIGANSAIFSLADALVLRPMPVPNPSGIVTVESQSRGEGVSGLFSFSGVSYPDYKDLRDKTKSFAGLTAAEFWTFGFATQRNTTAKMKFGEVVSGNFFQVLGVQPALGRGFRSQEDVAEGRDAVVVLSHDVWKNEFASDPSTIGRTVLLNGIPFTVVGVTPASFTGSNMMLRTALYVPIAMRARLEADPQQSRLERRDAREFMVQGRLQPGVTLAMAAAETRLLGQQLAQAYPATNRNTLLVAETDLQARLHQDTFDVMLLTFLMALSAVVLLIACANVMNLMLSRAHGRAREIAVRLAIGAGRSHLIRQSLAESLVIALLGGALGLIVAQAGVALFSQIQVPTDVPVVIDLRLDSRVLLFALLVSTLSAILFGLAPALQGTRPDLVPALKTSRSEGRKRNRLLGRNALVIVQVAGSLLLLVFASQAYRGASILLSSPIGFRTDHLLMATFDPSLARYKPPQTQEFYKTLLDDARDLAGVKSAALSQTIPMTPGGIDSKTIVPDGFRLPPGVDGFSVLSNAVSDGYFETVGMPIVEGRRFQVTDKSDSPRVAIVNEQFARKYYPNKDAVGKRFRLDGAAGQAVEIVGVAKQSKYIFPAEPPFEYLYLPLSQNQRSGMTLMLQTAGPSGGVADSVRELVRKIDPGQPIISVRTMEDFYDQRARGTMQVLIETISGLGLLGLALALIGLYGLMAYSVGLRRREIGIRMAVGADRRNVQGMVLKQGMLLACVGCGIGLVVTMLVGRPATAIIGASGFYLPLVGLVFVALLSVAALSAYIPARRASLLDPNTILRQE
jgi:macrolide transport system ATP-binding/permease protein